jgi:hypothetical protein
MLYILKRSVSRREKQSAKQHRRIRRKILTGSALTGLQKNLEISTKNEKMGRL